MNVSDVFLLPGASVTTGASVDPIVVSGASVDASVTGSVGASVDPTVVSRSVGASVTGATVVSGFVGASVAGASVDVASQ